MELASPGGLFRVAYFPGTHIFGGKADTGWHYARMPFSDATRLVGEVSNKGLTFDPASVADWIDAVLEEL
ncbi:hypothetical protein [Luteimonas saliphila]|uniref:hypothetical protein n=1 Tax=Luteimonas saliphila TaxID=2804919 RepID=UPI00192D4FCC|nr:hypothetical protein [Luteimonas saliphila]